MPQTVASRAPLALAFLSLWVWVASIQAEPLPPGVAREGSVAVGQVDVWDLPLAAGQRWRIEVDQQGLDVVLSLSWPGLDEPWRVDSPIDRDGRELVLLPATVAGPVRLELRGLVSAGGGYRVRIDPVDDLARLAPLAAMTEAGRAYAEGTGDGRRRAAERYRDAAGTWPHMDEPALAAQCLYAAAVLHRLLGERETALDLDRQVLPLWRGLHDAGREADTLNEIGLLQADGGEFENARRSFREALAVQERAGDLFRQAASAANVCLTYLQQGALPQGVDCYASALERIRSVGDGETEASVLTTLGHAYGLLARPDDALASFERALALHRAQGRDFRVAETLNNLGVLHRTLGEYEAAVALYLEALETFRKVGDQRWEARILHNLAGAYFFLGDPVRARIFGDQALEQRLAVGDRSGAAFELQRLGQLELELERPAEARDFFRRTLELGKESEDPRIEAQALGFLGWAYLGLGDPERALELTQQALASIEATGDRSLRANLLRGSGRFLFELGRLDAAVQTLGEALESCRALGNPRAAAWTLYWTAETVAAQGKKQEALETVDQALASFESLRESIANNELRATFSGSLRDAYDLKIELLMERHAERNEDPGALLAALDTSERARAWGLVELLRRAEVEASTVVSDPRVSRQLQSARRRFRSAADRLQGSSAKPEDRAVLEAALVESLADLEGLEARLRRDDPPASDLVRPQPLAAGEIQKLLEPGVALLEYALGRRRGWLFLVTSASLRAFELPRREVLEEAALRAYKALASPGGTGEAAGELSRLALAPALDELARQGVERLAVVPDGALWYLPFAALPLTPDGRLVLDRYEVVSLPSASVLALERARDGGRKPAPLGVAVVADPVFTAGDLRLPPAAGPAGTEAQRSGGVDLPRLRLARHEAEAITALAPPGETFAALDFEANRDLVLSGRLGEYRIVHFATHSLIDDRHPALSGLALSFYDRRGRPLDGFLRLGDVYGLKLDADLVVLSACRTALGREVRGEGLVGLVRGFLHAGSRRVTASLWSVGDRSTAELMGRFYRGLLAEKLPPATALRRAQLSLRGEARWQDPHHWAGFVLIGDWR